MHVHTVEKIGGTSISNYPAVRDGVIVGKRNANELYQRVFVVSAYAGVTNGLLEHKKTGKPGVYALFAGAKNRWEWSDELSKVEQSLITINQGLFSDPMLRQQADQFVMDRIEGVRSCLIDLQRVCSYGQFQLEEHLLTVREMLSGIGEAHSAFNTTLKLQSEGISARFVDLTGWREAEIIGLDDKLTAAFASVDLERELPICTGYVQCREGLMGTFDRGYSEMTFSRIAVVTQAKEAIIHKEFHLSSADPKVVGKDQVAPLGRTNYDVADQLANLGMEAIHPKAAKGLRQRGIPLRIKNTFEPDHPGTLITTDFVSDVPHVEIIAGREAMMTLSIFDQDMQGEPSIGRRISEVLERFRLESVNHDSNANTITHYLDGTLKQVKRAVKCIEEMFPSAEVTLRKVALISVIGSNIDAPEILRKGIEALNREEIPLLALYQGLRQIDVQFVMHESDYQASLLTLHNALVVENQSQNDQLNFIEECSSEGCVA